MGKMVEQATGSERPSAAPQFDLDHKNEGAFVRVF
jgi:hypothetical protein